MSLPTELLIDQLAARADAVRPLSSPMQRTFAWLAWAAVVTALAISAFGLRPDLVDALRVPSVALEWIGSVLTSVLAAYAAFQISVPGRSAKWVWLPVPAVVLWLAGVGTGCLGDWLSAGIAAFAYEPRSWHCSRAILTISLPLGLAMLIMVRHAGASRPAPTALLGALSAAALSAAAVSLFHHGESALMVLAWHLGAVAAIMLTSLALNRRLFAWVAP